MRETAETLLSDAEKQRDDLRAWAEEERELRRSSENSLEIEKKRTLAFENDLRKKTDELEIRAKEIEKVQEHLAALKKKIQQSEEQRLRYERLFACRLSANLADRWNRATKSTVKK